MQDSIHLAGPKNILLKVRQDNPSWLLSSNALKYEAVFFDSGPLMQGQLRKELQLGHTNQLKTPRRTMSLVVKEGSREDGLCIVVIKTSKGWYSQSTLLNKGAFEMDVFQN